MAGPATAPPRAADGDAKILSFRVGTLQLAIPAGDVARVVQPPHLTRVPHAPACLAGVVNLRGAVVPVLSLARLLDQSDTAAAIGRVILLDRNPPLGLAVDAVTALTEAGPTTDPGSGGRLFLDEAGGRRLIDLDGLLAREFGQRRKLSAKPIETGPGAVAGSERIREIGLLGFDLAGQTYALPLEQVREVMALPPGLAVLPRLDDALVGVVPHRGGLLPLASLHVLLGLTPPATLVGRVIVAQIGDSLVGLVVDRLNAVMRAPESAIGAVPTVLNRGAGEAQIDAIFRADGGNRLVSILSPERLFREETTGDILAESRGKEIEAVSESDVAGRERFVIFRLGDEAYGLPIAAVAEVARLPDPLTRLPRAPAFVEGVMNFRGKVIPLIDLRRRFEVAAAAPTARRRVLVTRIGELQAGFIVDAVSEVADLSQDQLSAAPDLPGEAAAAGDAAKLFDRVAQVTIEGRMVLLIDPAAMLDRVEADLLQAISGASTAP
jgi:purine-binding chemotaxis protein CheW